jgi:aspartyl-tRNA(Asn)/glutamyl-tRNA(Gln) amidotransferase subunit C
MGITAETVHGIAELARLELDDAEAHRLATDLDRIVAYVDQLQAVTTAGIAEVDQVSGGENVTREDAPAPMLTPDEALANAPHRDGTVFLVPKAVER